ncbi:hypothetical protein AFM12_12220 [Jiulongibacter sediminis]|uniref:Uncharacterized protein n=1 Tax=Jiulongibacter sediminis TaxID=1605367 RepID=A0A0P7BSR6_9BACT|nr:hypothetical protein AFM12_12220 [Jiulongibacter sediminis]TBX24160.1 hypothetical protein TK44_12230 [Jiulongibacter sediminis]
MFYKHLNKTENLKGVFSFAKTVEFGIDTILLNTSTKDISISRNYRMKIEESNAYEGRLKDEFLEFLKIEHYGIYSEYFRMK